MFQGVQEGGTKRKIGCSVESLGERRFCPNATHTQTHNPCHTSYPLTDGDKHWKAG